MIRFQLLVFSLFSSLIAIIGVGVLSFGTSSQTILDLHQQQLEQLALSTDRATQLWLHDSRDNLELWAESSFITRSLDDTYIGRASREIASARLAGILKEQGDFKAIAVIDSKQHVLAASPMTEKEKNFMAFLPLYFDISPPLKNNQLQLYQWQENKPFFAIMTRILVDKTPPAETPETNSDEDSFFLVALIDLDNLVDNVFLPARAQDNATFITLADTKTKKPLSSSENMTTLYEQPDKKLYFYHALPYIDWTIVAYTEKNAINMPAFRLAERVALLGFLTMLTYIIIKYFFIHYFIFIPVARLANTTQEIARNKDYSIRAKNNEPNEIGDLARSFNTMLDEIEKREFELSQANSEIRETTDRLMIANEQAESNRHAAELASEDKTKFLQSLSYLLRSPLNSIVMLSQELFDEKGECSPELHNTISIIYHSAVDLEKQLDGILEYSEKADNPSSGHHLTEAINAISPAVSYTRHHVLLIDNNMREAFLISKLLTLKQCSVAIAPDTPTAADSMADTRPDFILIANHFSKKLKTEITATLETLTAEDDDDIIIAWLD